nr:extensin-like [Penaeus vannamei]
MWGIGGGASLRLDVIGVGKLERVDRIIGSSYSPIRKTPNPNFQTPNTNPNPQIPIPIPKLPILIIKPNPESLKPNLNPEPNPNPKFSLPTPIPNPKLPILILFPNTQFPNTPNPQSQFKYTNPSPNPKLLIPIPNPNSNTQIPKYPNSSPFPTPHERLRDETPITEIPKRFRKLHLEDIEEPLQFFLKASRGRDQERTRF